VPLVHPSGGERSHPRQVKKSHLPRACRSPPGARGRPSPAPPMDPGPLMGCVGFRPACARRRLALPWSPSATEWLSSRSLRQPTPEADRPFRTCPYMLRAIGASGT
jgi:hypothetical protein